MYHLVTRRISGYYNIYCDITHDTTGVEKSIEECFRAFHAIQRPEHKSLKVFLKKYDCELIVSFTSSDFTEFKSLYPELLI